MSSTDLRSADLMVRSILSDQDKLAALAKDPGGTLTGAAEEATQQIPAFKTDPWVYRLVVSSLGAIALAVVIGGVWFTNAQLQSGLIALGAAAVGGLSGLLAPSPKAG